MRIVFMGSAELACPCLEAVASLPGHEIAGVVTQPDRPKGRSLKTLPPPVKVTAETLGLPVQQPLKIREPGAVDAVAAWQPDLIVVVAYGQFLPNRLLAVPARGCINLHTSLLPRWRGASPIQHAILAGDSETGVTTMFMAEQMDAGDIIRQRSEPIHPDDTSGTLHDRLARLGAALLTETVTLIANDQITRRTQDESRVTLAPKLTKEDGRIQWTEPAIDLERRIRAFDPWPGAHTLWGDQLLKVWRAEVVPGLVDTPGQVHPGLVVATGCDGLRLTEVQPAGKRRMQADEFLRGHPIPAGLRLG